MTAHLSGNSKYHEPRYAAIAITHTATTVIMHATTIAITYAAIAIMHAPITTIAHAATATMHTATTTITHAITAVMHAVK